MLWAMERKNVTAIVVMDLSAAFDTVDHDILLSVLENKFGIKDVGLRWFEPYLRPRSCKVSINSAYSAEKQLPFSVPQGSCAGPSLFLAYASTLREVKSIVNCVPGKPAIALNGFADDHSVKKEFNPAIDNQEIDCITDLEHCMGEVQIWMDKNCLKLNNAKTELILFGSQQTLSKCITNNININGHEVNRSQTIKCLGAWLDQELKMKQHIVTKCRIAMLNMQRIKYLRPFLTEDITEVLVLGLVILHIDYCYSLFVSLPETDISKLQRIQNIGAKLVLNKPRSYSATETLRQLHWLPIHKRIKHKLLTIVFKCLNDKAPAYLKNLLVLNENRRGLGSENNIQRLVVPLVRNKTFAARLFSILGPTQWNQLPNTIKATQTVEQFKKLLKTHLFCEHFETDT